MYSVNGFENTSVVRDSGKRNLSSTAASTRSESFTAQVEDRQRKGNTAEASPTPRDEGRALVQRVIQFLLQGNADKTTDGRGAGQAMNQPRKNRESSASVSSFHSASASASASATAGAGSNINVSTGSSKDGSISSDMQASGQDNAGAKVESVNLGPDMEAAKQQASALLDRLASENDGKFTLVLRKSEGGQFVADIYTGDVGDVGSGPDVVAVMAKQKQSSSS